MKNPTLFLSLSLIAAAFGFVRTTRGDVTVSMGNDFFSPPSVTIGVGDTITWTNTAGTHTSTSGSPPGTPDGLWDSGSTTSPQSFPVTFTNFAAGTYPYFCSFHYMFGMTGSVTVTNPPRHYFVNVENFSFTPSALSIAQGDTVTWTNGTVTAHTSTSGLVVAGTEHPDAIWSGAVPVAGYSVTFNNFAPRTYPYYCQPHAISFGMVGSVTVTNGSVMQPVLSGPGIVTNGMFKLTINGTIGVTNVLQFSQNALAFTEIMTNQANSASYSVTNSTDTTGGMGIYRVRLGP